MEAKNTLISNDQTIKKMEQLQAILDSVSSAIFEISLKGDILFANQAAVIMFGYTLTEFKSMSVTDFSLEKVLGICKSVCSAVFVNRTVV